MSLKASSLINNNLSPQGSCGDEADEEGADRHTSKTKMAKSKHSFLKSKGN